MGFERIGSEADADRLSGVVALGLALGGLSTAEVARLR